MTKNLITLEELNQIKQELKALLTKANHRVYTIITKVAPSEMSRHIRLFVPYIENGEIILENIAWYCSKLAGAFNKLPKDFTAFSYQAAKNTKDIVVQGCGMDMCFHLVYTLSSYLYDGDGYKLANNQKYLS
jgi:hypothetical protein